MGCDTCFDYIGPNPQTPGNGKCNGDRKGHATNGGDHCTGYKNNGWCHGDGGTQKWVQSVCPRTCGVCKSAASALADFDSFAINLDENGNYKKPCCGTYLQCCSSVRGDKLQRCKAKRLKNQVSKVCKTAIE